MYICTAIHMYINFIHIYVPLDTSRSLYLVYLFLNQNTILNTKKRRLNGTVLLNTEPNVQTEEQDNKNILKVCSYGHICMH